MAAPAAVELFKVAARSAAFSAPLVQAGGRRWACPDLRRCVWDPDAELELDDPTAAVVDVEHLGGLVTVAGDHERLGASGRMFPIALLGTAAGSHLSLTFLAGGGPTLSGPRPPQPLADITIRLDGCQVDETPAQGTRLLVALREGRGRRLLLASPARGGLDGVADTADDQLTLRVEPGGLAYAHQAHT